MSNGLFAQSWSEYTVPCSDGWVFVGRAGIFSRDVDRKMSRRATVHLASSNDGVANAGVKKKMEELEMLRLSIAAKRGNNVEGAPAFAIAKEQAETKEQEEAKKKEFAELNRMLEEVMAQKRNENDEKIARVQAKRGLSGIKAIADEHAGKKQHFVGKAHFGGPKFENYLITQRFPQSNSKAPAHARNPPQHRDNRRSAGAAARHEQRLCHPRGPMDNAPAGLVSDVCVCERECVCMIHAHTYV